MARYSTVTVVTKDNGLFRPVDEGKLEARMEVLFNGTDIDPGAGFTHVADIVAQPPTLCGTGTDCASVLAAGTTPSYLTEVSE